MAFIWAADSDDVRSEGMSYGMMIAVQMDLQTQFEGCGSSPRRTCNSPRPAARRLALLLQVAGEGEPQQRDELDRQLRRHDRPAPDGDEYFAAALYLADKRWGSAGAHQLQAGGRQHRGRDAAQRRHVATAAARSSTPARTWSVFYPHGASGTFTDPSYHLPAFYELFAPTDPRATRRGGERSPAPAAASSSPRPTRRPGLHPDYATFAGAPTTAMAGDGTTSSATTPGAW